ncbi:MAG: hypothetical protein JW951_03390 [Lentisphaerae bacterium]|nr:hypothetical protein [Lentisphaerota bacterium]
MKDTGPQDEEAPLTAGPYTGWIDPAFRDPLFLTAAGTIRQRLAAAGGSGAAGRHGGARLELPCGEGRAAVRVKAYARQAALKDRLDRRRGSKAARACRAARRLRAHGVGTPRPLGFLERWRGGRLLESYFLTEYLDGATCFRDELIRLFRDDPECARFMALLETVAGAVRRMHAAGFRHNDLGNQNILLQPQAADGGWIPALVDLNRGFFKTRLSDRDRARDVSRIALPSDLLRVFKEMLFAPEPPPRRFQRWERFFRRAFAVHTATRAVRRPRRTLQRQRYGLTDPRYPREQDMWIWDSRSGQPVNALRARDRARHFPPSRHLRLAGATAAAWRGVRAAYRELREQCFIGEVAMRGRTAVAVEPWPGREAPVRAALEALGRVPLLVRFYAHAGPSQWDAAAAFLEERHGAGHPVSAALVQSRGAVLEPGAWGRFVRDVLQRVGGLAEWIEVGHAINRVKWGVWDFGEYRRLLEGVAEAAAGGPAVRLTGPAVIDFEYPFVLAALQCVPEGLHFDALSHHLYVDRRGAPENRQGGFRALDKFALGRALARWSPACEDRFIVSEVNWPLRGTGVHSPVGAPYVSPGPRTNDPSVSEAVYADYMVRYLLIALCSGMAERVTWWRLGAYGYGLMDDRDPEHWRARPAYRALRHFLHSVGRAAFVAKLTELGGEKTAPRGIQAFLFRRPDGRKVCAAYTTQAPCAAALPWPVERATDVEGAPLDLQGDRVPLSGRPVYVFS